MPAIQPTPENPWYWSIDGKPVLLLGGSVEDNLFQIGNLSEQLDLLADCGGNYVRCSMSARDEGNVWPFHRDPETGLYDLDKAEGPYWERFGDFIKQTRDRGIVVQIEVFDRFDFARDPWQANPFNPKNNMTYTAEESGLADSYAEHPGRRENPFFRSPPALGDNALLRKYQERFVDRILAVTLGQPHVLYCISNETNESPEWGKYWATFIKNRTREAGETVFVTEMWDARELDHEQHRNTWMHPELYDFVDISQVNHQQHWTHWENLMTFRQLIEESGHPRPMNSVKIYGANSGSYGTTRDAQERLWRNMLAGLASARFHRPNSGIGLSPIARANIRSARIFSDRLGIFSCRPETVRLLSATRNEAYATADPGRAYGLYFPDGGQVLLECDAIQAGRSAEIHWLDIRESEWLPAESGRFDENHRLSLNTPREEGYWACVVRVGDVDKSR